MRVLLIGRQDHADPLALAGNGLIGEPRVCVRPLDDGRDAEAPGRAERLQARQWPCMHDVDLVGETGQRSRHDPVV